MPQETEDRESLELTSELRSVEQAEDDAGRWCRRAGFDEETAGQFGMVTREAVANAVLHGNRGDAGKRVRLTFELSGRALTVRVADQGEGFNAEAVPDPLAEENLLRGSGRGLLLMRAYMDEVHFRTLGPGTEITLVRYRHPTH